MGSGAKKQNDTLKTVFKSFGKLKKGQVGMDFAG